MERELIDFQKKIGLVASDAERLLVTGIAEGLDALVLGDVARERFKRGGGEAFRPILHIARDDKRLETLSDALAFFAPDVKRVAFPAWDCVPYDRVSPNTDVSAKRIAALTRLIGAHGWKAPVVVLTTINALLQRLPSRDFVRHAILKLAPGISVPLEKIALHLDRNGYARVGTVMEAGDYAMRGGIIDLFPPGRASPVRLDFFGDELESIREFDPETQRSKDKLEKLLLMPVNEVAIGEEARTLFRRRYTELFGAATSGDPLYEAISNGVRFEGMEHWLPLFHSHMETLFDYLPEAMLSFDPLIDEAKDSRLEQVTDHYQSRRMSLEQKTFDTAPYKPIPPNWLYLTLDEWNQRLAGRPLRLLSPFELPQGRDEMPVVSFGARQGRNFAAERGAEGVNVFELAIGHIYSLQQEGRRVVIASWSKGARERLQHLFGNHGLAHTQPLAHWHDAERLKREVTGFAVLGLEQGFTTPRFAVIAEQDILGDRLIRKARKRRKDADVLKEVTDLSVGDAVVHVEHGIGRFMGLKTIDADGAPHDCLELHYQGGDRLYLPVENIELLSRYGGGGEVAVLDKLGGAAWQARKAKLKQRIKEIAEKLIRTAALRELREAPVMQVATGEYEEFAARFNFEPTEDQQESIDQVLADLEAGRPMDRLVCGDVGFGKTEVAMRAAFTAAMSGHQVAVVVPTTLLARQHFRNFRERFDGYPLKLAQASRMVSHKDLVKTKEGLTDGTVDIVVGTHALLAKDVKFANLGLLIIDEEQHFGVAHKERLKQLREDVHVLTLTATPIPRTLQLSLSGLRGLSMIATPPVDRLAVRSFVMPFDPMILREALLRERFRGGQSFYVCPRIKDLPDIEEFLHEHIPELKVAVAHGQMAAGRLEDIMNAFYDRQYDVLLSTTIIESGLDIPTANTLIVHRADKFGLAQLYQLRGRVGRSKTRAYAYFTTPLGKTLTEGAHKRLKVLQSLDTLGAGFTLASHDLDIRGAGNLLGEEQSGHIREVGYELYQQMLEEAVASLRGGAVAEVEDHWSPQISIGTSVLIPEHYVADLQVRMGLYRRLSTMLEGNEIEGFAAELTDRFGTPPVEVLHLLEVMKIKLLCRDAGVGAVHAGPRGAVIVFHHNQPPNPDGVLAYMRRQPSAVKLQPDQKLVVKADWPDEEKRLNGTRRVIGELAEIARKVAQPQKA
jgi:transcription-repair coupling factor (superfamily II helicase)